MRKGEGVYLNEAGGRGGIKFKMNERFKMVKQYAKKPVVISAVQFTGENISEILEFADNEKNVGYDTEKNQYYIKTLEGNHCITDGDYIIRGVEGEYYPCKERIFEKTYIEVQGK